MQRLLSTLLIALCATAVHEPAAAQAWPSKPITIVVPFPAGGGTDAFARPVFAHMTKQLGQPLSIDNRGGAGGNIGASLAAKANADGYTWFMGAVHHTIAPAVYPKLDYSLTNDFVPVALIAIVSTWTNLGADPPTLYGPAFGDFIARETKRWGEVVTVAGIKLD